MIYPAAIQAIDEAILHRAYGSPNWALPFFYVLTVVGGGWPMLLLVPLLLRARTRAFAIWLALGVGTTTMLVDIIKSLVQRVRPCDALPWAPALRVLSPGGFSFPSGHAAGSFAFAGFIIVWAHGLKSRHWALPLSALAIVYAGLVAWSRCVLGVHYPSDVAAGTILGLVIGVGFGFIERKRRAPLTVAVEATAEKIGEAKEAADEKLGGDLGHHE